MTLPDPAVPTPPDAIAAPAPDAIAAPAPDAIAAPAPYAVAAPPPRRRTGLVIGVGVAVAAVLAVAGGTTAVLLTSTVKPTSAPPTRTPTAAAPTTPAQTDPPAYAGKLQDLVVPKSASAVYAPAERKGAADGSMTIQDVASEFSGGDVLNTLTTLEFQRGLFLAWRDNGTLVYIQIYQFRYEREAGQWEVAVQRGIQDGATSTAVFDEIPYGRWFVTKTPDGRGAAHAYFHRGPFVVMIDTFRAGTADLDGTRRMAVSQYALLPE
jgi:hypothetical protein